MNHRPTRLDRHAPVVLVLLGAVLFLPLLGSFGFWDPTEVRIADAAKVVAQSGWGRLTQRPPAIPAPFPLALIATGFRLLGAGELAGRLPIALAAIVTLLACYYAGLALLRRGDAHDNRSAFLGALALATMPAFLLSARQLMTAVPLQLTSALAIGGGTLALWPQPDTSAVRRLGHGLIALVGLGLGQLAGSTLLGVTVPLAALSFAGFVAAGPSAPGAVRIVRWPLAILVVVVVAAIAVTPAGTYTMLLAGTRRAAPHGVVFVTVLKRLGFAAFPWIALLPLALALPWSREREPASAAPANPATAADTATTAPQTIARRARFARTVLLGWAAAAYLGAIIESAWVGEVLYPGLAAVALLAGDCFARLLDHPQRRTYIGFLVFIAAVLIAHDFAESPEQYAAAHIIDGIKWPDPLFAPRVVLVAFGCLWALVAGLGIGLGWRMLLRAAGVLTLVSALGATLWLIPELSRHLSSKGLFARYQSLGGAGSGSSAGSTSGELGQYHAAGRGIDYYFRDKAQTLATLDQVFAFLARPGRTFIIIPVEELAPIEQHAKSAAGRASYVVVDDSNSRFLLLSNRLASGESDRNPLHRLVVQTLPRQPQHLVQADFQGLVELVGYDLPPSVERGKPFPLTLYYRVKAPLRSAYKIFVHIDGAGNRINGDHVPLDGKFPTTYWVPGYYIIDEHRLTPERTRDPAGTYQIYTGFFLGAERLKIVAGANDHENRAPLGPVRIR